MQACVRSGSSARTITNPRFPAHSTVTVTAFVELRLRVKITLVYILRFYEKRAFENFSLVKQHMSAVIQLKTNPLVVVT